MMMYWIARTIREEIVTALRDARITIPPTLADLMIA
jgi:hypothetical protein